MSLFLFLVSSGPRVMTGAAMSTFTPLLGELNHSIFWRVFMAVIAVCFCSLSFAVCQAAERQTTKIKLLIFGKYLSWPPPAREALKKRVFMQPSFFSPLADRLRFSPKRNLYIAVSVIGLLLSGCPFAIVFRIAPRVINSLKSVTLWPLAHVFEKLRKAIPILTDLYTLPAVAFVCVVFRVVTAIPHLYPHAVERSFREPVAFIGHRAVYYNGKGKST